ncbi:helix-turn-helix domain-containing protein [Chitinophagaceae bacterium MMS25-I14]
MSKSYGPHIGDNIKRLRSFKQMTQQDLADKIGRTRSLVSFLERTGSVNKYTLKEVADALNVSEDVLEDLDGKFSPTENTGEERNEYVGPNAVYEELTRQLRSEIAHLKETVKQQWDLLFALAGRRPQEQQQHDAGKE